MKTQISLPQKLLGFCLRKLSQLGVRILVVTLGDDNPNIAHKDLPGGYTTTTLEPEDLIPWIAADNELNEPFLHAAQARGDRCVANFFDDSSGNRTLAGYGFVTTTYAPVTDQVAVSITPNLRYRYKGWTHPQHRRKYLSHARGRLNQTLFPMDAGQRMVSYVEAHNFPSRLNTATVKPVEIGSCLIVRLLGRVYLHNSAKAQRLGFKLVKRADYEHGR